MNLWTLLMLVSAGLFAGGAAAIAWERIPSWRSMPQAQFVSDFAQVIRRADKVQPAILVVAILTALVFGINSPGTARLLALIGTASFVGTLIASIAILVPLQRRIITSPDLEPRTVDDMKRHWYTGHIGRSAMAIASFLFVTMAAAI